MLNIFMQIQVEVFYGNPEKLAQRKTGTRIGKNWLPMCLKKKKKKKKILKFLKTYNGYIFNQWMKKASQLGL